MKTRSCERAQPFNRSLNASRTTDSRWVPDTLRRSCSWLRYCWMRTWLMRLRGRDQPELRKVLAVAPRVPGEQGVAGERGVRADVEIRQRRAPGAAALAVDLVGLARHERCIPRQRL